MVFKDIVQVVGLNSWHTKMKLMSKSPKKKNIKVIRHPDHRVLPGTESSFLYSHHEKTVVIDQRIAFIGGIDLCWGRWDTDKHSLVDLSDENVTELKLAEQVAREPQLEEKKEEAAVKTTERMADNAKEIPVSASGQKEKTNECLESVVRLGVTIIEDELNSDEKRILEDEENAEQKPKTYRRKWRKLLKVFPFVFFFELLLFVLNRKAKDVVDVTILRTKKK